MTDLRRVRIATERDALGPLPGRVEAIRIAAGSGAPMTTVWRIRGFAGRGLEGDRYHEGTGEWSDRPGDGRGLTLVAAEVLEKANAENPGLEISPADTRRNVTTRGVDLTALVGREFRIGGLRCVGVKLAEPCAYLEGLVGRPILRALTHRAGLRANILEDGEIAVGDEVVPGPVLVTTEVLLASDAPVTGGVIAG